MKKILLSAAALLLMGNQVFAACDWNFSCTLKKGGKVNVCKVGDKTRYQFNSPRSNLDITVRNAKFAENNGVGRTLYSTLVIPNGTVEYHVSQLFDRTVEHSLISGDVTVFDNAKIGMSGEPEVVFSQACKTGTLKSNFLDNL